ncbi:MAG TPA: hypothetical protein VE912_19360 [Bacteroidales bacterium]|nr:hypothetical protein [Bacteroidales bacterium]
MKKITSIIAILLVLFAACNGDRNKGDEKDRKDIQKVVKINEMASVISSVELRKALKDFIIKVDSIPNPFGRTVCYSLSFYKKAADTMLVIEANVFFPEILEGRKSYYEMKGSFSVYGKEIAIFDYKESLGRQYYDKSKLKINKRLNQIDSLSKSNSDSSEAWTFVAPFKLYEIKNNELIKIDSYFGK